jgi:hypothetical protein
MEKQVYHNTKKMWFLFVVIQFNLSVLKHYLPPFLQYQKVFLNNESFSDFLVFSIFSVNIINSPVVKLHHLYYTTKTIDKKNLNMNISTEAQVFKCFAGTSL